MWGKFVEFCKPKPDPIDGIFKILTNVLRIIMSDVADLKAAVTGIKEDTVALQEAAALLSSSMVTVLANIQALKDQVAAGGVVSQADLDALVADAQAADAAGDTIKEALASVQAQVVTAES